MIEINHVHYAYRMKKRWFSKTKPQEIPVLKGTSLSVQQGELFGLVGPNGSGKTTLTKLLIGVYEADQGSIFYQGKKRPSVDAPQWKEAVGWLSGASTRLFSTIDLNEHLAMYRSLYRQFDMNWVLQKLEEFKLTGNMQKMPTQISFGERIKFELILSLAYRPKVLLLDEPTVGLDPMAIQIVRHVIKEYLREEQGCGILTSHNLKDITEVCEHGGFLQNGIITNEFKSRHVNSDLLEEQYREVFGSA